MLNYYFFSDITKLLLFSKLSVSSFKNHIPNNCLKTSRTAAKTSLEIYSSNAANSDSGQLKTTQKDISGQKICFDAVSSLLLLLSMLLLSIFFSCLLLKVQLYKRKKQTRYGFTFSKLSCKRLVIHIFSFGNSSTHIST